MPDHVGMHTRKFTKKQVKKSVGHSNLAVRREFCEFHPGIHPQAANSACGQLEHVHVVSSMNMECANMSMILIQQ